MTAPADFSASTTGPQTALTRIVAGRYRLRAEVGRGGMGIVWHADDEHLGRPVAIKQVIIPVNVAPRDAEVLRERVVREARAAGMVRHPSAVPVFDVFEEDGVPYLVMELIDSTSLAHRVRDTGPLSVAETTRVGLGVLGALEVAHAAGVLHRDVKPGNVLLADDGRVLLTDFGIASAEGDPSITATGLLLGSPAYIPPERVRGGVGGPESDLWALAATLWTAVEGGPAYEGSTALATLTAVVEGRRNPPILSGELGLVLGTVLDAPAELRPKATWFRNQLSRLSTPDAGPARSGSGGRHAGPSSGRSHAATPEQMPEETTLVLPDSAPLAGPATSRLHEPVRPAAPLAPPALAPYAPVAPPRAPAPAPRVAAPRVAAETRPKRRGTPPPSAFPMLPSRGRRRADRRPPVFRRRGARGGALIAVVAIAAGVVWTITRSDGGGPAAPVAASGFQTVTGTGWSMAVPADWPAYPGYGNAAWHQSGSYSTYVEEDDVAATGTSGPDAAATLDAVDRAKRADPTLRYQQLSSSGDAAKATLTWREYVPANQRWLRLEEEAVAANGRVYVVVCVAADEVFGAVQGSFDKVLSSFRVS